LPDVLLLFLAGSATALATGLGAIPVFLLGERAARWRPAMWGFAAGAMTLAAIVGLLEPALDEGQPLAVVLGSLAGIAFLLLARRLVSHEIHVTDLRSRNMRTSLLVFAVLFVHSLPEGLAIGTAYASDREGLSLFVIVAIGLQNIPEGTSVAIPMAAAGFSRRAQFWAAVGTSVPQPFGALLAYALVQEIDDLLPFAFAFAASAMLALVAFELVPPAYTRLTWRSAAAGTAVGAAVMVALSVTIGV
jgi:zinc transporter, ZIP family